MIPSNAVSHLSGAQCSPTAAPRVRNERSILPCHVPRIVSPRGSGRPVGGIGAASALRSALVESHDRRDLLRRKPFLCLVGVWIILGIARFLIARLIRQPEIMTDELAYWQMARSFWEKGVFLFHGKIYDIPSILYPMVLSRLFAIPDLALVFDLARLVNGFLITAVIFPTFALARMFIDSEKAVLPAILAGLVPGVVYSSLIMAENLYYPLFCLSYWLAFRTLQSGDWRDGAWAAIAFLVTYFTKPHLLFLAAGYALALAVNLLRERRRAVSRDGVAYRLLPRLIPFAGLGAAVAVRISILGGFHSGQSWKGILGGEGYSVVFASIGGGPIAIRIPMAVIGLILTFCLGVAFVPAVNFFGALSRFRILPSPIRTYVILLLSASLVYLAGVTRVTLGEPQTRMQERYLFILAPMFLVLLFAFESWSRRKLFVATASVWLAAVLWLSVSYRQILNWNLQSDSPSLTAFFLVSRRFPGVVPLILAALVTGALVLASMWGRRVGTTFGALALLFILLNAGWYANVWSVDGDLRRFKRFALNVATRVRAGETVAVITDGLDPRVVWALEFWLRNPVALLTVSEQKTEWWIYASGSYEDILRTSRPSLVVAEAGSERKLPTEFRLVGRAPGLPTPALLYSKGSVIPRR
jgi:hypothetical protein